MSREMAREWILSALADLKSISHMMGDEFLTHVIAFHAQQCVEKCLKAVLEYASSRVPREHSTLKLYGLVKNEIQLEIDTDMLTDLDDVYIDARYPGDLGLLPHGKPTLDEAKEFYSVARHIFETVCEALHIDLEKEK